MVNESIDLIALAHGAGGLMSLRQCLLLEMSGDHSTLYGHFVNGSDSELVDPLKMSDGRDYRDQLYDQTNADNRHLCLLIYMNRRPCLKYQPDEDKTK